MFRKVEKENKKTRQKDKGNGEEQMKKFLLCKNYNVKFDKIRKLYFTHI